MVDTCAYTFQRPTLCFSLPIDLSWTDRGHTIRARHTSLARPRSYSKNGVRSKGSSSNQCDMSVLGGSNFWNHLKAKDSPVPHTWDIHHKTMQKPPSQKRGASYLNPKHFVKVPGLLPGTVKSQLRHSFSSKIKTWGSPLRWFGPPALEKVSWLAIKTASLRQVGVLPTQQGAEIPDLFRIWGLIILWIARMFVIRVWKAHRHVVVVDHKLRPHGSIFGDSGFTETDRCPNPRGLSFVSSWISSHQVPMTMMVNSNDIQAPSRCPELESKRSIWYTSNT